MLKFIQSIKVFNQTKQEDVANKLKCLKGLCLTINSVLSLLTRRLNQDPLENFFGTIRQQGGNLDTPTPLQFTRAFKKLFFRSVSNSPKRKLQ